MKPARSIAADTGRELLAEALARRSKGGILIVDLPAPVVPVDRLLSASIGLRERLLWEPGEAGESFAGLGVGVRLRADGPRRFEKIRRAAQAAFRRLEFASSEVEPVFAGGFAFAAGFSAAPWRELGQATFILPRWTYALSCRTSSPKHLPCRLTFCSRSSEAAADVLAELEQIQAHIGSAPASLFSPGARRVGQMTKKQWGKGVAGALSELRRGTFEKLVLARVARVQHSRAIDVDAVLARLARWHAEATRFAFAGLQTTFVGLTPERLVELCDGQVRVDALAGTAAPAEVALLERPKDRLEHRVVVNDILQRLGPHCERVWASARPQLRSLPNVVHLLTPIRGQARADTHVLDLVEALHPTPAVAGRPAAQAVQWIARHEAEPRGWYAGPVGWFDRHGNGDFAVAIRSALIQGTRAWAYAGSGIVPGSDPEAEYAETTLKLHPMLEALGVAS